MANQKRQGTLYIVATPIGNLGDMVPRAVDILQSAAVVAAEDTRHSAPLLRHFGVNTPLISCHEHSERGRAPELVARLMQGEDVALISDAGTPLISDPGYRVVREARQAGVSVVPIPGPCAAIAALSVSGLATDRFCFEGFLPQKGGPRREALQALVHEARTLVFYESPHRIDDMLVDCAAVLGEAREAVFARELTKTYETVRADTLGALRDWVAGDSNQRRGEIVLVVAGYQHPATEGPSPEAIRMLQVLAEELPLKQAAQLAAKLSGEKKNALYRYALDNGLAE